MSIAPESLGVGTEHCPEGSAQRLSVFLSLAAAHYHTFPSETKSVNKDQPEETYDSCSHLHKIATVLWVISHQTLRALFFGISNMPHEVLHRINTTLIWLFQKPLKTCLLPFYRKTCIWLEDVFLHCRFAAARTERSIGPESDWPGLTAFSERVFLHGQHIIYLQSSVTYPGKRLLMGSRDDSAGEAFPQAWSRSLLSRVTW